MHFYFTDALFSMSLEKKASSMGATSKEYVSVQIFSPEKSELYVRPQICVSVCVFNYVLY